MQSSTLSPFTTKLAISGTRTFVFRSLNKFGFHLMKPMFSDKRNNEIVYFILLKSLNTFPAFKDSLMIIMRKTVGVRWARGGGEGCQVGVLCPRSYSVWFTRMIYIQKMYFNVFYFRGTGVKNHSSTVITGTTSFWSGNHTSKLRNP